MEGGMRLVWLTRVFSEFGRSWNFQLKTPSGFSLLFLRVILVVISQLSLGFHL